MRRACSSALCICMKEQSPTRYPRKVPWSPESCHVRLAHHLLQSHVIACSPQSSPFNYKSIHSKPARTSNINNLHPIPQPPTPLKHHRSIHKNRILPAQPPAPNPLPNNSFHPIENHKPQITPQPQITQIPNKPPRSPPQPSPPRLSPLIPHHPRPASHQPALEIAAPGVHMSEDV